MYYAECSVFLFPLQAKRLSGLLPLIEAFVQQGHSVTVSYKAVEK